MTGWCRSLGGNDKTSFRPRVAAAALILIVVLTLCWFASADFYRTAFTTTGAGVSAYLGLRVVFTLALAWITYFTGRVLLMRMVGHESLGSLQGSDRFAASFLVGAGLLHVLLLGISLFGVLTYPVAAGLFVGLLLLSSPHLAASIQVWKPPRGLGIPQRVTFAVLIAISLVFVVVKGLYPGGGHDYWNHYFPYLRMVVETRHLENQVWYHFFYSKGAGLYFVGMLLTDALAPQLVTSMFIFCGAVLVFCVVREGTGRPAIPYIGAILFVLMFTYTPATGIIRANGGWGDLEKEHEIAAIFILGIVWAVANIAQNKRNQAVWVVVAVACVGGVAVVETPLAVLVGCFLGIMVVWGLIWRDYRISVMVFALAASAGVSFLCILLINYQSTGIFLDSLMTQTWRYLDLQKVSAAGITLEVLWTHNGITGIAANAMPISWAVLPLLAGYLRLDIWWPILVASGPLLLMRYLASGRGGAAGGRIGAVLVSFGLSVILVALIGGGLSQTISFYRLSTFSYGPMLCAALILFAWAAPTEFSLRSWGPIKAPAGAVVGAAWALIVAVVWQGDLVQIIRVQAPIVVSNAMRLAKGDYSLAQAYENQQGLAGRLPWGGIYPGVAKAIQHVQPGTPVWSLHIHSYCMIPDCDVRTFLSFRFAPAWPLVYYGSPELARTTLHQEGLDYFFYSSELPIQDPLPASALFSPDHIKDYLGVVWSDGTSYLLTWSGSQTTPITEAFLNQYRHNAVDNNPFTGIASETWRNVAFHVLLKGGSLRPFALPWGGGGEPMLVTPIAQGRRAPTQQQILAAIACPASETSTTVVLTPAWVDALLMLPDDHCGGSGSRYGLMGTTTTTQYIAKAILEPSEATATAVAPGKDSSFLVSVVNDNHEAGVIYVVGEGS